MTKIGFALGTSQMFLITLEMLLKSHLQIQTHTQASQPMNIDHTNDSETQNVTDNMDRSESQKSTEMHYPSPKDVNAKNMYNDQL